MSGNSNNIIEVQGLGKRYRVGEREPYLAFRDLLTRTMQAPFRGGKKTTQDYLWALRDINLEVQHGEVMGLIGRNGAGKSTLLKILARITRPTTGFAEVRGRVGSLLEVGTGFHPELTGRENVFLSGAILGMSKAEIERKFDEIVAFAEVERFLDTPLKHYSSGMQMRLAFAVAAHLEPEILLVDEVLAVGDIAFQKKCLGKMGDIARAGRTIILVSHNMAAINALSSRAAFMRNGRIELEGSASEVTTHYYAENLTMATDGADLLGRPRQGNGKARFSSITIQALSEGEPTELAPSGCDLRLEIEVECYSDFENCVLAAIIYDANGYRVIDTNTQQKGEYVSLRSGNRGRATFLLRHVLLKPGRYFIGLWLGRHGMEVVDDLEHAISFDIVESEETCQDVVVYPGVYLCRFENTFTTSI